MNCMQVQRLVHGYVDGELDLAHHLEVEQHADGCAHCKAVLDGLLSLRTALKSADLAYRAPASLRERLRAAPLVERRPSPRRRRYSWAMVSTAAAVLLTVLASGTVGWLLSRANLPTQPATQRLAQAVLDAHLRSLQGEHLFDVPSSNMHTVKPWFTGRVPFSPPVVDLADKGFTLAGGRLDYLDDRPVAALVYRRHKHVINLFLWPSAGSERGQHTVTERGYHMLHWNSGGMTAWAISDLNEAELEEFAQLFQAAQRATPNLPSPDH